MNNQQTFLQWIWNEEPLLAPLLVLTYAGLIVAIRLILKISRDGWK